MDSASAPLVSAVLKRLAAERVRRGLTQEEVALRAGIDRTHVGLLEKGLRSPSLEVVLRLAWAMEMPLAGLLIAAGATTIEAGGAPMLASPDWVPRRLVEATLRKADRLGTLTGLTGAMLLAAAEKSYATLDLIDAQLLRAGCPALAGTVELANLSSMLGNILGAAIADQSAGLYKRNGPHKFPDLLPLTPAACDLEIKVTLESNRPKGHLPKPGMYLTVRYVLGDRQGRHQIGVRGDGRLHRHGGLLGVGGQRRRDLGHGVAVLQFERRRGAVGALVARFGDRHGVGAVDQPREGARVPGTDAG